MNRSNTVRFAAMLVSAVVTFSIVALVAGYAYPEGGAQLAAARAVLAGA